MTDGTLPQRVGVLGAGTIGGGWATLLLRHGFPVVLCDQDASALERARVRIAHQLRQLADLASEAGLHHDPCSELSGLATTTDLGDLADVDYVQESVVEDYDVKQQVFADLEDVVRSDAVLASSTSGLFMSRIAARVRRAERCVVVHPYNPPYLIPAVEIVAMPPTSSDVISRAEAFVAALEMTPVRINAEIRGFVANRLAAALWREAIALVDAGVVSVEGVEAAVTEGLGLRWAFTGPNLTYHLGGGAEGLQGFWDRLGGAFEDYFAELSDLTEVAPETIAALHAAVERMTDGADLEALYRYRDEQIFRTRLAKRQTRTPPPHERKQDPECPTSP